LAAKETRDAFLMVTAAKDSLTLQKGELVPLAKQTLEAAQAAYRNNGGSIIDLLDAQRRLLDAELNATKAEVALQRAVAELERAVGGFSEESR
jgi:outer membrane protein TolC